MNMYIVPLTVPAVLYFGLPWLLGRLGAKNSSSALVRRWLLAAVGIYFVSWWLPSPLIDGVDTSFTTHFVGGGVFCGVLGIYLLQSFDVRPKPWQRAILLFALVSSLGVLNELFELTMVRTGMMRIRITDTSWDLLANTLGAMIFFISYYVGTYLYGRTRN